MAEHPKNRSSSDGHSEAPPASDCASIDAETQQLLDEGQEARRTIEKLFEPLKRLDAKDLNIRCR